MSIIDKQIAKVERQLEELKVRRELWEVNDQLSKLKRMRELYPPHRVDDSRDDDQPCALHTAALSS